MSKSRAVEGERVEKKGGTKAVPVNPKPQTLKLTPYILNPNPAPNLTPGLKPRHCLRKTPQN